MALTATSVDVERVFSKGRLILSHVRNGLSVQSTRALMCIGAWSRMGLVKDRYDGSGETTCEDELDTGPLLRACWYFSAHYLSSPLALVLSSSMSGLFVSL